jgi:hypothetical protein
MSEARNSFENISDIMMITFWERFTMERFGGDAI